MALDPVAAVSLPAVPMETLILTAAVLREMVDHALACDPEEACGLFSGPPEGLLVDGFHPVANTAPLERRPFIYELDGQGMLDVERAADAAGRAVLGVMHSHTHTHAYPSPTDVADAARFDPFGAWVFVIVSLENPEPYLRAFRISGEEITEVSVAAEPG